MSRPVLQGPDIPQVYETERVGDTESGPFVHRPDRQKGPEVGKLVFRPPRRVGAVVALQGVPRREPG